LAGRRAGERGRRAIAAELAAKGIGRELIGVALGSLGEDSELEAAARMLRRRPAGEPAEKSLGRLARKGFSREVIAAAWRRL
jgi:SOS response regulatory protein OraA/RecX